MEMTKSDWRAKCVEYALRIVEINPTAYGPEPAAKIAAGVIEAAEKLEEYIKA